MSIRKTAISFIILVIISVILFANLVYLYDKRFDIKLFFVRFSDGSLNTPNVEADKQVAFDILNGGYILHFRHANRDKWHDASMYDVIESNLPIDSQNIYRYGEGDFFEEAVCLSSRGIVQAKAIKLHIEHIKLPVSYIITSPSCRARQTAEVIFNRYDKVDKNLLHRGPFNEQEKDHIKKLRRLYLNLPLNADSNIIVSAHNNNIHRNIFDEINSDINLKLGLSEGGFYVIKKQENKLKLVHRFYRFSDFSKFFYER